MQWAIPYILQQVYQDSRQMPDPDEPQAQGTAGKDVTRRKKLKRSFFSEPSQTQIRDFHACIWPGIPMPAYLPAKTGSGQESGRMPERTVPTSIFIAMLAWELGHPGKRMTTVARAHEMLRDVLSLASSSGTWTIVLPELRFFHSQEAAVSVGGFLSGEFVWGQGRFERKHRLLEEWDRMLDPWLHICWLLCLMHCLCPSVMFLR